MLTPQAVDKLFVTLRQLSERSCSILYISHKLGRIRALCHHCTVLRGGKVTGESTDAGTNASLSRLMIGFGTATAEARGAGAGRRRGATGCELSCQLDRSAWTCATSVSRVRAGEIVGVAGVSGSSQQGADGCAVGRDRRAPAGSIRLFGQDIADHSPRHRRHETCTSCPKSAWARCRATLSLAQNTLLTRTETVARSGWIDTGRVRALAQRI